MENYANVVKFMAKLARDAEKIINKNKVYKIMDKGARDVVTDLDLMIERHCIDEINKHYPNASIVSEEYNSDQAISNTCFTIDPIDGTKNFSHGLPFWGIQLSYFENGDTVASVIYLPEFKIFIESAKGMGTLVNGEKAEFLKTDLEHSMWLIDGNEPRHLLWDALFKTSQGVRSLGTSVASYAFLLAGKVNAVVNKKAYPWDVFPGYFACQNAGLYCTILNNGIQIATTSQELLDFAKSKLDVPIVYENTKIAMLMKNNESKN